MKLLVFLCVLSFPSAVFTGSHSLSVLTTYIEGETPFPAFNVLYMLDDITVGYFDSETDNYVPRGNTTNEDEEVDHISHCIKKQLRPFILDRLAGKLLNKTAVKPRVRLIKKANSDSGGFRVSCLATGFYPRHINLTLFRDGQPVSDHEITGGDLLPNGDGTYQMRKSLEISADKHKYSCSVTHLSLDNKLHVTLEFDPGEPFKSVIPSVLIVLALLLVFGTGAVIYKYKRRRAASSKGDYSSASTSEESTDTKSTHEAEEEVTQMS
ncbi:hypothetical protein PO909_021753 [Leuciscus waleckii]